jgi:hypothetical protein
MLQCLEGETAQLEERKSVTHAHRKSYSYDAARSSKVVILGSWIDGFRNALCPKRDRLHFSGIGFHWKTLEEPPSVDICPFDHSAGSTAYRTKALRCVRQQTKCLLCGCTRFAFVCVVLYCIP